MTEYKYKDELERKSTQQYEGAYSPEEIELNKELLAECIKETVDFAKVEELLKKGADPLGGTAICGWDILDHIYGEIIIKVFLDHSRDSDFVNLPGITEVFLKHGMNIDAPRIPYSYRESMNPLWHFTFVTNENGLSALKMLLDHGLSADSFAEFWDHSMTSFFNNDWGDPQNDKLFNQECVRTFRMLLFGASYDHIIENDEDLAEFICCDYNTNDVHIFRDWNGFEYRFDTSHCEKKPELYGSIIHIYSRSTGNEVWRIGVGERGRRALEEMDMD